MVNTFSRHVTSSLIRKMVTDPLWTGHLKDDCYKKNVFLAFRDGAIDFYYKGGRLFEYRNKGFGTDITYASIIDTGKAGFIYEENLADMQLIGNFSDGYNKIKNRCKQYAGDEAQQVFSLCKESCLISKSLSNL
jgi:hypothetical protein